MKQEESIRALTENERVNWKEDSNYIRHVRERIVKTAQSRHSSYLEQYFQEKGCSVQDEASMQQFDPIDLALYICRRLQTDNDWLVDKLAMV